MYILWNEKDKLPTSSSLQTCFVVAHSSGQINRQIDRLDIYIYIYIYIYIPIALLDNNA